MEKTVRELQIKLLLACLEEAKKGMRKPPRQMTPEQAREYRDRCVERLTQLVDAG